MSFRFVKPRWGGTFQSFPIGDEPGTQLIGALGLMAYPDGTLTACIAFSGATGVYVCVVCHIGSAFLAGCPRCGRQMVRAE